MINHLTFAFYQRWYVRWLAALSPSCLRKVTILRIEIDNARLLGGTWLSKAYFQPHQASPPQPFVLLPTLSTLQTAIQQLIFTFLESSSSAFTL